MLYIGIQDDTTAAVSDKMCCVTTFKIFLCRAFYMKHPFKNDTKCLLILSFKVIVYDPLQYIKLNSSLTFTELQVGLGIVSGTRQYLSNFVDDDDGP